MTYSSIFLYILLDNETLQLSTSLVEEYAWDFFNVVCNFLGLGPSQ